MESWDDENFEPPVKPPATAIVNKWEGEDEDEDVKESWEDEDEEKKEDKEEDEEKKATELTKKPKKKLVEKIAEKERQKREELEKRLREQQEEEISEEEKIRMQKESDLKLALETTFGGSETKQPVTIDGLAIPETKEQFEQFADSLAKQLTPLSKNIEYPNFVEVLTRNLCATMLSNDIKKVKNTLDNLFLEKQKIEKGDKPKKNKGKGKAKLKLEGENELSTLSAYVDDFDDYNDFM